MLGPMNKRTIDSTTEWLVGALGPLGAVEARRMFGGQGVYRADAMFAIVHEGRSIVGWTGAFPRHLLCGRSAGRRDPGL